MRAISIVGAPLSLGIRPYDDGGVRRLDLTPRVLRDLRLVEPLAALDYGDVDPPPYRDIVRPAGRPRNEDGVIACSRALADRIAEASAHDAFVLLLGGDCSIVLGSLLRLRHARRGPVGLVYVDAHADFGTPEESRTGSAASMCLALAVGRGDTPLTHLDGEEPLVKASRAALIGRRDHAQPWYGLAARRAAAILDPPHAAVRARGTAGTSRTALDRLSQAGAAGFWIHFDADVLDPGVMPTVDSPEPGGFGLEELADGAEGWPPIPSYVHVYVADVDVTYKRALEANATSVQAPVKKEDEDKRGGVKDAGGTTWWIATKVA